MFKEEYRPLRPRESAAFAAIAAEYLPGIPPAQALAMPVRLCCVRGGQVIGVAFAELRAPRELCLQGIAIAHPFHAQGRGGKLLQALEEEARRRGYEKISLGAAGGYVERFYRKNGYRAVELKIFGPGGVMVLPVSGDVLPDRAALTVQYGGEHSFFVFEKMLSAI